MITKREREQPQLFDAAVDNETITNGNEMVEKMKTSKALAMNMNVVGSASVHLKKCERSGFRGH